MNGGTTAVSGSGAHGGPALALRGERFFHAILANSLDGVSVLDREGRFVYETPSMADVLGYPPFSREGDDAFSFVHPDDVDHTMALFGRLLDDPARPVRTELRGRHRDGSWIWLDVRAVNLLDDPDVAGIVVNMRDVTDKKTLEKQLAHQAFHDPLTGVANRALFTDRVAHALTRRGARPATVLFLDLDRFKIVNDSLGHARGDGLLCQAAERIASVMRQGDTLARVGGDEFAILLEDAPRGVDDAVALAGRIVDALEAPFVVSGIELKVSASIGIAAATGATVEELLRDADIAMYRAKGTGRGGYEVFDISMHTAMLDRLQLESDLAKALERHELELHYQPTVSLGCGTIAGVEALLRWNHPTRGTIQPADFIPIAEDTGLIVPIGRWVLEQACRQAKAWHLAYPTQPPLEINVNLSGRQLVDDGIVADLAHALRTSGVEPSSLVLELTESVLMHDTDTILERLRAMKDMGVQLAIDDFGTGYSSLGYLRRLPVDVLKLDRSFVSLIDPATSAPVLVRALLDLGRQLGLELVAEGVEHAFQVEQLRSLGCARGQGFLWARPQPADAIGALLGQAVLAAPPEAQNS